MSCPNISRKTLGGFFHSHPHDEGQEGIFYLTWVDFSLCFHGPYRVLSTYILVPKIDPMFRGFLVLLVDQADLMGQPLVPGVSGALEI